MNSRQRVEIAMKGGIPDRVPVMCQLSLGHYFLNCEGLSPSSIWFDSESFAEALVRIQRKYRFDGILINLPGRLLPSSAVVSANSVTWADGSLTTFPPDDNPRHSSVPRATLSGSSTPASILSDLDRFVGYTWNIYHIPSIEGKTSKGVLTSIPGYFTKTIELVRQKTSGTVSVHGEVFSPFTHLVELLGVQEALEALATNPKVAHELLDGLTPAAVAWAEAQARAGVDAVLISSAYAGGPFISKRMYREFVLPYERRVVEAIRAAGCVAYTHTCGKIGDRLELMKETGTCGIDTMDPPPLGNVELSDAKKRVGSRMFLKGNMNAVALLGFTTREQVADHAKGRLASGMAGGRYILSTACSVAPRTEPWKLSMLVEVAEEHGKY